MGIRNAKSGGGVLNYGECERPWCGEGVEEEWRCVRTELGLGTRCRDGVSAIRRVLNSVMSDSDESGVTHTEVSSPFEDLSDIGSPRADDHELLELPHLPEDPYLEAALQAPPSPDYVRHSDRESLAEDQPYAEDASPIALSPDYVPESDPEADPEEDDDEDPEEDPIDYPADGGDDGDDEMDIEEDGGMLIRTSIAEEEDEDDEDGMLRINESGGGALAPDYHVVVSFYQLQPRLLRRLSR
ncbi:hypothetical protein Tco_0531606 [Tanacetum coccineum]